MAVMLDNSEILVGDKVFDIQLEMWGEVVNVAEGVGFTARMGKALYTYGKNGTIGIQKRVYWDKPVVIFKQHKHDVKYDIFLKCLPHFYAIVENIKGVKKISVQQIAIENIKTLMTDD